METGPWPHLDRRQERGVVWGGRHRFPLEVPANFGERRERELRGILLPRTPVNKPGMAGPATNSQAPQHAVGNRGHPERSQRTGYVQGSQVPLDNATVVLAFDQV